MKYEVFLSNLLDEPVVRVKLESVKGAFFKAFPEHEDHPNFRAPLKELLDELKNEGKLVLPQAKHLWDKVEFPDLPHWVEVVTCSTTQDDPEPVTWLPEIGRVATQVKQRAQVQDLKTINAYLIEHRNNLVPAPYRERSLKIFGDEHYLDKRVRNGSLFGGRLPLQALFAFEPTEPMPYERPPSLVTGRPLLVVENHHSFASFVSANAEQNAFSAICYASGNTLASREYSLDNIGANLNTDDFYYLGDIDPQGLSIPIGVNSTRRNRGVPLLRPATGFYSWLLENGLDRPMTKKQSPVDMDQVKEWFKDGNIAIQIMSDIFKRGKRVAQECLGIQELVNIDMKAITF